jgi:hypothetical protein
VKYAEPSATPLTDRVMAEGGHKCDRCGSLVLRSPRAFAYHAKKCTKKSTPESAKESES